LPVAREIVKTYVEHRAKLPWFIDLLNLNIGNDDPAEAKRRIARFVDEFNSHGQRLADNMRL